MRLWLSIFFLLLTQLQASEWSSIQSVDFHESCLVERSNYPAIFFKGINKGLSCLKNLNTKIALTHHQRLNRMIDSQKLKITCNESDYRWAGVAARGSFNANSNRPELGLIHPFISFKPASPASEEFLSVVSFHEAFHNLGYSHGKTFEYPYSCEDCCFTNKNDLKSAACKICSSEYSDLSSPKYLSDLMAYQKLTSYSTSLLVQLSLRRALLKSDSLSIRELMLESDSKDQPLTILLAKRWSGLGSRSIDQIATLEVSQELAQFKKAFARITEARALMFDAKDFAAASEMFLSINLNELAGYAKVDKIRGTQVITSLFHDLDALWEKLGEMNSPLQIPIDAFFQKVRTQKIQLSK